VKNCNPLFLQLYRHLFLLYIKKLIHLFFIYQQVTILHLYIPTKQQQQLINIDNMKLRKIVFFIVASLMCLQTANALNMDALKFTKHWSNTSGSFEKVNGVELSGKEGMNTVRIQVDEDSCNAYLLVGHAGMKDNISPYTLVHTVNGQKIKFTKYGRNNFWGSSIYKAQSQKGQKFFLDQFINKSEVVIDFWPKAFKSKYKDTFSAKGFTKAFNNFVNECKSGGGAL
jgi:hypothetical protein